MERFSMVIIVFTFCGLVELMLTHFQREIVGYSGPEVEN